MSSPTTPSANATDFASGYLRAGIGPGMDIRTPLTKSKPAPPRHMTGPELRRTMGKLKLTTLELAYMFGETAVEVQRWRHSKAPVPNHVALYLQLMQSRFAA